MSNKVQMKTLTIGETTYEVVDEQARTDIANLGTTGVSGDGGYYIPSVIDNEDGTMEVSFAPSKEGMQDVASTTIMLPSGTDGVNGEDGVSATHSWDGTVLTITSASGTSSADLKGDKGDAGQTGKDGTSATHSWNGTVLTINSAAGTSSMDLKGEKGDKGDKGETGTTGADGKDGFSPIVEVAEIEGGHRVSITDADGVQSFDVLDGVAGEDGKSAYQIAQENGFEGTEAEWLESLRGKDGTDGTDGKDGVSVTHSWNGTNLTINSASGSSSVDLKGAKGDNGITPHVGENGNWWIGTEDTGRYVGDTAFEPANTDLPRIFFTGSFPQSKLDADESLEMTYISKTARFSAYVIAKVQGSSSTTFAKKNYTFKLFEDEAHESKLNVAFRNWPAKNKFVAKANTIDRTHARNVVSCRIWGDMVKSRAGYASLPAELRNSPNMGAIDGFPVQIYLNGVYQGLYTWNIPKDDWMAGLDEDMKDKHAIICGEGAGSGAAYVSFNTAYGGGVSPINGSDWDDECDSVRENIRANFKAFSDLVVSGTDEEFRSGLSTYMNIESLIDSFIFKWLACDVDGLGKNQFMYTYNAGLPWYSGVYDLDSTWGLKPEGYALASYDTIMPDEYYYPYTNGYTNRLYARLWQLFETEIRARWNEVKAGALSLANVINHFEAFHDAIPHELFAEDSAETTAGGLFVNGSGDDNKGFAGMLGVDKSNIQQIRNFAAARWMYVDGQINRIACEGISLSVTSLALTNVNATGAITATLTPVNCNDPVAWKSSSDAVAIVSGGTVTAIGNGSCTITATCGGFSATCAVTVSGFAEGEVGSDNLADPDGDDWYHGHDIGGDGSLHDKNVDTVAVTNKIEFRAGDVFTIEGAQAKYRSQGNASHGFYNLDGTPAGWAIINAPDIEAAGNLTVSNKVTTIRLTAQMLNDRNINISHGYVRFQLKMFDGQSVIDTENIVIRRNPNGENADAWA